MRVFIILFLFASFGFFSGCATIISGSNKNITITSEPQEAKVYINGGYRGKTPVQLSLKTNKDYSIRISKKGYDEGTAIINRSFNAMAILNLTSPLCWAIDVVTGALWTFDDDHVTVHLSKKETP